MTLVQYVVFWVVVFLVIVAGSVIYATGDMRDRK